MTDRRMSFIDNVISNIDTAITSLSPGTANCERANPANAIENSQELSIAEQKHIAGLMRINHTGEVCAQALYQGQAATAAQPHVRQSMQTAANEEIDHLAWCEQRLSELNSQASLLNPAFYAMSFGIGALAGAISDKISLGFVAATEEQVCKHLQDHLAQLPEADLRTKAILEQMLSDEAEHATQALQAGGHNFPDEVKIVMSQMAKVMTKTTYKL